MFKAKTASVKGDNDWPFWIITDGGSLNISNKVVRKLIESNKLEPTETLMDWVLNGGVLLSREKRKSMLNLRTLSKPQVRHLKPISPLNSNLL